MSEDLTATIRLGATIICLAANLAAVVVLTVVVIGEYNQYVDDIHTSVNGTTRQFVAQLRINRRLNGANAYKFICSIEPYLERVTIEYVNDDGTTYVDSDLNTLLRNAHKNFAVGVDETAEGEYIIVLNEEVGYAE